MSDLTKKQLFWGALTLVIYTFLIGFQGAVILIVAVGFHEYSHLFAARKLGLPTKGFFLVPFMGGVAIVEGRYSSRWQQAQVVLAGPAGGALLAVVTGIAYAITGLPLLAQATSWMCALNLFNLLPLSFMDGGQLMDTVSYSINRTLGMVLHVGSTIIAFFVMLKFNYFLAALVLFMGGQGCWNEIQNWKNYRAGNYYLCSDQYLNPPRNLRPLQFALTIGGWVLTAAVLIATILLTGVQVPH